MSPGRRGREGVRAQGPGQGPGCRPTSCSTSRMRLPTFRCPELPRTGTRPSRWTSSRSRPRPEPGRLSGKQTTSWYASYAPADDPEYVVVMMVPEGGTGSGTSAPSVNEIYKALFGIDGSERRSRANAIIPDGKPDHRAADGQPGRHDRAAQG